MRRRPLSVEELARLRKPHSLQDGVEQHHTAHQSVRRRPRACANGDVRALQRLRQRRLGLHQPGGAHHLQGCRLQDLELLFRQMSTLSLLGLVVEALLLGQLLPALGARSRDVRPDVIFVNAPLHILAEEEPPRSPGLGVGVGGGWDLPPTTFAFPFLTSYFLLPTWGEGEWGGGAHVGQRPL